MVASRKAVQQDTTPAKGVPSKQRFLRIFDKLKGNTLFRLAVLWLCPFLVLLSFLFTVVLSDYSYIEIFPKELIFPVLMNICTAALIAIAIYWLAVLRSYFAKLVAAIIMALLLIGYDSGLQAVAGLVQALVPGLTDSDPLYITSAIYLIILYLIAVWIGRFAEKAITKESRIKPRDVQYGILVIVGYLFLVPAFSLADILPTMIRETSVEAPEFAKPNNKLSADKPDVYYIVLDRYGSSDLLKDQFSFDNSQFTGYLRSKEFYINDDAHSNYPYTAMSISSTMSADYTNTLTAPFKDDAIQSRTLFHNLSWQSPVVKAFKKEGYKYYTINSRYGLSYKAPLADQEFVHEHQLKLFGKSKLLRGIEAIEFLKSPYYRFAKVPSSIWPLKINEIDQVEATRQQINSLDGLARQKAGGRLIFAHILVPHDPFFFNADGSLSDNPSSDSAGQPIKHKYTNQVLFINTQMRQLVDTIQEHSDGKAVVVMNADEGPYPQGLNDSFNNPQAKSPASFDDALLNEDMRKWSDNWLKMKFGILQAVHIPRATSEDLDHLSSVNVFRIVLNRYLGYDLPYRPQCQFGLIKGSGNSYEYANITKSFSDSPDPECRKLQSL